jgi:hypothetical protein
VRELVPAYSPADEPSVRLVAMMFRMEQAFVDLLG